MGIVFGNSASLSGVLMLPVLGLSKGVRLVGSIEKTNNVVCSFVFSICSRRGYLFVMVTDPRNHTGKLSSTSSGAHGRDAPTKSRHSIEEESAPAVKRKCIREHQDTPECRVF